MPQRDNYKAAELALRQSSVLTYPDMIANELAKAQAYATLALVDELRKRDSTKNA